MVGSALLPLLILRYCLSVTTSQDGREQRPLYSSKYATSQIFLSDGANFE
jgi:hypothetical protein